MDDPAASTTIRPLARSLDPLTGESLGGYLLRLACRLHLTPIKLARRTGCAGTQLSRRLLLDLDVAGFARAARLTFDQTAALTLVPWADRYPPIARSQDMARPARVDSWLFSNAPRYCPQCLAGDGSPIQLQYGGPWKKIWHLPISFACTGHRVFLRQDCPRTHPPQPETWRLIARPADSTLHPAQCRQDDCTEGRKGKGAACGARVDQTRETGLLRPDSSVLETQQRLLDALNPHHPADDAARYFTDLRVITALPCASWPLARDLVDTSMIAAVTEHLRWPGAGARPTLGTPPAGPIATAALLTAATVLRDNADLQDALARHLHAAWTGRPSRAPWAQILDRHQSSCSQALRQAAEPAIRAYRRQSGPHSTKAPARGRLPPRTHSRSPGAELVSAAPRTSPIRIAQEHAPDGGCPARPVGGRRIHGRRRRIPRNQPQRGSARTIGQPLPVAAPPRITLHSRPARPRQELGQRP